ncbi:hypothetical protein F4V43_02925 [Paenibacillus spiritus]|uniref:Uncharacterized protein n=1 Tax=Paenibacillus spiritus TaxID=2496557 RepID=A0A5J5GIE8_9BACL|nr:MULTISPECIES: hypothetical protein [Paenibacillus]KAA9007458.1 hypothetical protein F4V43_02925 [Paenibacillus spiritus]
MTQFVLFILFSIIEAFALFYLAFKIFKIDLYPKEMVFATFIMGFFSYFLRHDYNLIYVDITLQYTLAFCFLWMLFRIHPFFASIMVSMAYLAYMFLQSLLYLVMTWVGAFSIEGLDPMIPSYVLQVLSAITGVALGLFIEKKRKGFDFVPDKPDVRVQFSRRDRILFALSLPSLLFVLAIQYFASDLAEFFFLMPFSYAALLYGYMYLSYKKDRGDDEYFGA